MNTEEPISEQVSNGDERLVLRFFNSDSELNTLASRAAQSLGVKRLDELAMEHQRFDETVYVIDKQGKEKKDYNFKLKRLLEELPDYIDSAQQVGLSVDQAHQLAMHLLRSSPYKFHDNSKSIALMGRGFRNAAERNSKLDQKDLEALRNLVGKSAKNGVDSNSMYAYSLAQKIGLSTEQSVAMITKLFEVDGILSGYTFRSFCDALKTLNVAEIDPDLVVEVFDSLGGDRPYFRQNVYRAFRDVITFGCPSYNITPQKTMEAIKKQVKAGKDIVEVLSRFTGSEQKQLSSERRVEIVVPQEERDRYFVNKSGDLEIAALPYQTHKSLNAGIRDLEELSTASGHKWQEIGEGFWVFDSSSGTWYSLGGQAAIKPSAVRHNMISYDISQLSDKPLMFHCHPQDFEFALRPPIGESIFPEQYEDHVVKFLAATPSRADYVVVAGLMEKAMEEMSSRSYIVHSLGITEFTYPHDIEKIKKMSLQSRDIRDKALLDFNWDALKGKDVDLQTLVKQLTIVINQKLPDGFSIQHFPHGHNFKPVRS